MQEMQETQVLLLGQEDAPRVGNGNPLQYSCLENAMDREAWQVTVHGVAKSWTGLFAHTHTHTHTLPVKKKSLGLDGFNGKVYQKFQEELISTLVKLFQKLKKAVMLETQCIRLATP